MLCNDTLSVNSCNLALQCARGQKIAMGVERTGDVGYKDIFPRGSDSAQA
jgi:hypothetical protein